MTTTTLTLTKERAVPAARSNRRSVREFVGWNHRATVYWAVVGAACLVLTKVHP